MVFRFRMLNLILVWMFAALLLPQDTHAAGGIQSGVGGCRPAMKGQEGRATHLYFTIPAGRDLLVELQTLRRSAKEQISIQEQKSRLYEQQVSLYRQQADACDRVVTTMKVAQVALQTKVQDQERRIVTLESEKAGLNQRVAVLAGQRWQYLLWGIVGGVAITVGVTVGVVYARSKTS